MDKDGLNVSVEEACLNAWPALSQVIYDGWLIRMAGGETRRSNSVNVIGPVRCPLDEKIQYCEELYGAHGLPTIFRIRSLDDPALDAALKARGYCAEDETRTIFMSLSEFEKPNGGLHFMEEHPTEEWLAAYARFVGGSPARQAVRKRLLDLIILPTCFVGLRDDDGHIVSVAYGVVHHRLLNLQWVATDPVVRGKGYAQIVLNTLLGWAVTKHGAEGACLQVVAGNKPAVRLYEKVGFNKELYRYHYRVIGRAS